MNIKKVIFNFIGYAIVLSCVIWTLILMLGLVLYGGMIFYESNIFISLIEFIAVIFALIFLLFKLLKKESSDVL